MITNPEDFFQQIQNLCEEVALKIKAISSSLSSYLTKADAEATYLGKSETATSADKATNDANGNNISNTYLKSTTAASTYLKQTDAASTYLGKTAKAASATTADTATRATQDGNGNDISSTYLTRTDASSTYLDKTAKATSAATADTATKATQDASGNVITATYATKTELANKLDTSSAFTQAQADNLYLGKTSKAESAKTADAVAWDNVNKKPALLPRDGDAGEIKTYETVVTATTVNDSSTRSMSLADGGTLTVENGSTSKAWITVIALAGTATITLGSSWSWSGSAPTLAKGLVTCAWYGTFGVATFTKFGG